MYEFALISKCDEYRLFSRVINILNLQLTMKEGYGNRKIGQIVKFCTVLLCHLSVKSISEKIL